MKDWLDSVYSDGTEQFLSNPEPVYGEIVTIRIRVLADAPVDKVLLRWEPNGLEHAVLMRKDGCKSDLQYYAAELKMTENRMRYRFYIVSGNHLWYYNQIGITTGTCDGNYDFTLLCDYRQPKWVKEAVFYQIFPERFCNGDPDNDVKDGEISIDGHSSRHMNWTDTPLKYSEGFCMDFFGGDLDGIRQKIPYFKKLGVTALYLNPIFASPSVHKYDCIDYYHVDPHFGGDEALARLSSALHENGMRLVLDISINHTGTAHRWFNRDGLYFDKSVGAYNNPDSLERGYYFFQPGTDEYKGWDDLPTLPVLNYTSQSLRDVVYQSQDSVIRKWLKPPYNIDGWRFDVADVFARNNEFQLSHEVWPELCKAIREENKDAYILAEDWGDCAPYLQGDEYDAPMNYFGCSRIVREFFGGKDLFFERSPELTGIYFDVEAEQLKNRIIGFLAKMPYVMAQNQFNLLDSHDVPRMHHMEFMNPEKVRGSAVLMFLLPGAANIYYGDEADIDGWTDSIEGRRFPMPWNTDFKGKESFKFYQTLCQLKKEHKALSHGGMKFVYAKEKIVALARFDENEIFVGIISSEENEKTVTIPLYLVGARCPKNSKDCFGRSITWSGDKGEVQLTLKPHEALLFECSML